MAEPFDFDASKVKLRRFLIIGAEEPIYTLGVRDYEANFRPEVLHSIDDLTAFDKVDLIIPVLEDVVEKGYYNCAMLAYALAYCMKSESEKLRSLAYAAIPKLCVTAKQLFLLLKFLRIRVKSHAGKIWGAGFSKAVRKWYSSRDTTALVETFVQERSFYGFCHKDVIKQIHYKPPNADVNAVINYFLFEKDVPLPDEFKSIGERLKELKSCEDDIKIAHLLGELKLDLRFIPNRCQKSLPFWQEYVKLMPVNQLLYKLEFFTTSKHLSGILSTATSIINDCEASVLSPAEIYIALRRYDVCAKTVQIKKAISRKTEAEATEATASAADPAATGKNEIVHKGCPTVISALKGLLEKSIKALTSGSLRWVVGLDLLQGGVMECPRCPGLTVAGAAALTLQWIQRVGSSTSIISTGKVEIMPDREATVSEMTAKLRGVRAAPKSLPNCIKRAIERKMDVDVFLILSDSASRFTHTKQVAVAVKHLQEYREVMKRPKSKLVIMFLRSNYAMTAPEEPGLLIIKGFDCNVPNVIDAFTKDSF